MATKRRSTREKKVTAKYFKESSSEDEEDDDKTKAAKQKLKQLVNEDSEAESDFETEMKSKDEESSESEDSDNDDDDDDEGGESMKKKKKFSDPGDDRIGLSESDSSDDETSHSKVHTKPHQSSGNIFLRQAEFIHDDTDDAEGHEKLMALAGNLEKLNEVWKEKESTKKSGKTKKEAKPRNKRKSTEVFETVKKPRNNASQTSEDSISKLLAQGEGVEAIKDDSSDDEIEEKNEPIMKGVEITVALPENMRKKKRKTFDIEAHLKRELAKARRQIVLNEHKCNLVCCVAHLLHLHQVTSSESLQCLALSLVPPPHLLQPHSTSQIRLGHLVSWLRETVPVNKHSMVLVTIFDIENNYYSLYNAIIKQTMLC